jgi:hypothetical protein
MAAFAWKIPYEDALRSEPEDLLDRIQTATMSIIDRFHTIALAESTIHLGEHRALCLALSDLRVLRIAFLTHAVNGRGAVPLLSPVCWKIVAQDAPPILGKLATRTSKSQ